MEYIGTLISFYMSISDSCVPVVGGKSGLLSFILFRSGRACTGPRIMTFAVMDRISSSYFCNWKRSIELSYVRPFDDNLSLTVTACCCRLLVDL